MDGVHDDVAGLPSVLNNSVPESVVLALNLPFANLSHPDLATVICGPRISSLLSDPIHQCGPVSIRNYIAGDAKRMLRTSKESRSVKITYFPYFQNLLFEIKLTILEYLYPIDLLHLSQVSKSTRRVVMNPICASIWKNVCESNAGLVIPPRDVSYSTWVFMIYGPNLCHSCGRLGGVPDLAFQKCYCHPCMRGKYVHASALHDYDNLPVVNGHIIFSLVRKSYRYGAMRYRMAFCSPGNAIYDEAEIKERYKKHTLIHLLVDDCGFTQLIKPYEDYEKAQHGYVSEINNCADDANHWAMNIYRKRRKTLDAIFKENAARCMKRLLNLGHAAEDIGHVSYAILHVIQSEHIFKLSPRTFRKIRSTLEFLVGHTKVERIKHERTGLIIKRYIDYQKSLEPDRWQYLPPVILAPGYKGFRTFLDSAFVSTGNLDTEFAFSQFPLFISEWTETMQQNVLSSLPKIYSKGTDIDRLDLATSVFTCNSCKFCHRAGLALFGWNNVFCHRFRKNGDHAPCRDCEFNGHASTAAASLVSCLGLDPATTTIDDMNAHDRRFLCGNCVLETPTRPVGERAFTWIECVEHTVQMQLDQDNTQGMPGWLLLTPEATKFVKEHEYSFPRPASALWRCNKCAVHFFKPVTQPIAIDHICNVHAVNDPIVGVDVVVYKKFHTRSHKPFRFKLNPPYQFKCKKCPDMPITQLWPMWALEVHLLVKHSVSHPVAGEDWKEVVVIARAGLNL